MSMSVGMVCQTTESATSFQQKLVLLVVNTLRVAGGGEKENQSQREDYDYDNDPTSLEGEQNKAQSGGKGRSPKQPKQGEWRRDVETVLQLQLRRLQSCNQRGKGEQRRQ